MRFKLSLIVLLAVVLLTEGNGTALAVLPAPRADVYLVFSGTATEALFSGGSTSTATTSHVTTVYLIVDLSDNSSYSVLTTRTGRPYHISSRVLSADGTSLTTYDDGTTKTGANPAHNFINGITNNATSNLTSPTKGYVAFRYGGGGTDTITNNSVTHDYPTETEVYATGAQVGLSRTVAMTIVPAVASAKVSGVYTINPISPAITNYIGVLGNASTNAYPRSLSGQLFSYGYDSTLQAVPDQNFRSMEYLSVSGKITLTLNVTLTSLANVGGSFKLKGQLVPTTINPVAGPLTSSSSPTIYEDFLYEVVQALGLPSAYVPTP